MRYGILEYSFLKLLTTKLLDYVVQFVLSVEIGVGKDLVIQSLRVCGDTSNVYTNILSMDSCRRYVARASNGGVVDEQVAVNVARR
jgi:hypothetical protein